MTTQYGVTRLESDMTHSDKHQLEQAERQLQDVEKELSTLLPKVERLQKQQRSLQADIRSLKNKAGNDGHANMQGEKSINSDGLSARDRFKHDMGEEGNLWQQTGPAEPPGERNDQDNSGEGLSPRERFMRDSSNAWRDEQ